ncbi:MAG: chemotaxis protein CheX [Candidatus Sulfotelmatobacter sp.]|jgi:chemotaxis protein CheX
MSAHIHSPASNGSAPSDSWRLILREAVTEVFSMMVGAEVCVAEEANPLAVAEVTGMVGLAGELCGILSLRCGKSCASKIASKMLGVPIAEAAAETSDAIGEICNMVAGNFKAKIDGLQDRCMLSVPTVIVGGDYQLHSVAVGDRIELPFLFAEELLWIVLEVRS